MKALSLVRDAFDQKQSFDKQCLSNAAEKHFFNVGEFLIEDYYGKQKIDTLDAVEEKFNDLKLKQQSLHRVLSRADSDLNVITPIFKWAQSLNEIFIESKYSHRIDSPSCSDIFDQKIKITENFLNLTAKCRRPEETVMFKLDIQFMEKVSVKKSKWEKQSLGRIIITLNKKAKPKRWGRLFMNAENPPKNFLWTEKHDLYEEELNHHALQYREEPDDYDEYDHFVAKAKGIELETKFKMKEGPKIETKDVTDEIKMVDMTEEMRHKFKGVNMRDQLLRSAGSGDPIRFGNDGKFIDEAGDDDEDEYEYYDDAVEDEHGNPVKKEAKKAADPDL